MSNPPPPPPPNWDALRPGQPGDLPGQPLFAEEIPAEMHRLELPPVRRDRFVEIPVPDVREIQVEVPHVQYVERIEEVGRAVEVEKTVPVPKLELIERTVEIPKYIQEEKIVEVPQVQIIDTVEEVVQCIPQEKIIERPKIILQERVIPIPRRVIEEKIVEVPAEEFEKILAMKGPEDRNFELGPRGPLDEYDQKFAQESRVKLMEGAAPVKEIVEVPHVQHLYRNVMQPQYRHIPKPVEVPLTHYRPKPVERLVDRNVPVPVELEIIQEFLCPRLEAKYREIPVPVCVTRNVEKPVPADAMFNSVIMDAYLHGPPERPSECVVSCVAPPKQTKEAMTDFDLMKAGISTQPSLSHVEQFQSRAIEKQRMHNIQKSQDFLTRARTIVKEGREKF